MNSTQQNLLWITYDGSTRQHPHELRSALKQHVMLNFLDKKGPEDQRKILSRRKSTPRKDAVVVRRFSLERLACPHPTPALVSHEDQIVYRAAWWHCYVHPEFSTTPKNVPTWQEDFKRMWNAGFWEAARQDQTLLEVFISFAAAKEAAVKCLPDAPAYYRHRGKALVLIAEDVNNEGPALRMDAVSAIAILCFNYFIEGDYDSAEVHCQALASLVPTRINSFPSMIWQVVTAVDMYLSGIRVRGPTLPYHLHESFRSLHFYNPNENIVNAASRNLFQIPTGLVFSEDQAHRTKRLLLGLYGVAHSENRSDISCNAAWAHIYDVSYLIAQLQVEVERHGSLEEHIFLVGCQMQFWGMMTDFCYQPDVQRNQLRRLAQAITSIDPKALCDRWSASVGNLDSLLWTLCNAGVTTMYLKGNRSLAFEPLPHWLHPIVAYMIRELELKRPEDLKTLLQRMPFTDRWNDRACRAFPVWSEEEFITPSSTPTSDSQLSSHPEMSKFERLRLNFDYWLEEYPRRDSDR